MADNRDRFLDRWSSRKRGQQQADHAERDAAPPPAALSEDSQPASPDEAETAAAETAAIVESLPDIETLDENADFTAFLRDGVPEALRRQALRKLWRLNPVFANLDGLNDYDEDFTLATSALTQVKTIYQVGRGMLGPVEPAEGEGPAEDETLEAEIAAGDSADTSESMHDPAVEDQVVLRDSAGENLSEVGPAATEPPPAAPTPAGVADANPAKRGAAAERRWARFKA